MPNDEQAAKETWRQITVVDVGPGLKALQIKSIYCSSAALKLNQSLINGCNETENLFIVCLFVLLTDHQHFVWFLCQIKAGETEVTFILLFFLFFFSFHPPTLFQQQNRVTTRMTRSHEMIYSAFPSLLNASHKLAPG